MNYPIEDIEGIGKTYGEKLRAHGIKDTDSLLEKCNTKSARAKLAQQTNIPESLIITWVNHADLFRVNGIGPQFAELLEAAGVDTVKELATRNAENLHEKVKAVNDQFGLTNRVPSAETLANMIAEAKSLKAAITH